MCDPRFSNPTTPFLGISPEFTESSVCRRSARRSGAGGFRGKAMLVALLVLLGANAWIGGGTPGSGIVAAPAGLSPVAVRHSVHRADWINDMIDILEDLLDIIEGTEDEEDEEDGDEGAGGD
jgi:hypothetical protein